MATVEMRVHQAKSQVERDSLTGTTIQKYVLIHSSLSTQSVKGISRLSMHGTLGMVLFHASMVMPHAFDHVVIRAVVHFIQMYAEVHGLPQPAAPRGMAEVPPTYLPASQNFKTVHSQYVRACCEYHTHVGYDVSHSVWHQCMPHAHFMTPRTDVCALCEDMRQKVQSALTEEEKISRTTEFKLHITRFEKIGALMKLRAYATTHFDFAEQLHLPNHTRQVGPLYI